MYRLTAADLLVGCLEISSKIRQETPSTARVVDENQQAALFCCPG